MPKKQKQQADEVQIRPRSAPIARRNPVFEFLLRKDGRYVPSPVQGCANPECDARVRLTEREVATRRLKLCPICAKNKGIERIEVYLIEQR